MSTTPTPEPTTPPIASPPTPEAAAPLDITAPAADLRAAAVAANQPAPTSAPAEPVATTAAPEPPPYTITETPEGAEIKLITGAVYKGKTIQEAAASLAAGKVEGDKTIRQLRTQTPPVPPAPAAPAAPPTPVESPEEIQAREWIVDQQAKALGMTREQYVGAMQGMMQTAQEMQMQTLAASFMQRCPDFPNSAEASQILVGGESGPGLLQQLNLPATPDGLEAAHLIAVRRGLYKPVPPPVSATQRPSPAPMLQSGSAPQVSAEPNLYEMPLDELRKLAAKG